MSGTLPRGTDMPRKYFMLLEMMMIAAPVVNPESACERHRPFWMFGAMLGC